MPVAPLSVFELLDVTAEQWASGRRAGARAARGFHFQDAALTLLIVRGVIGTLAIQQIVPEGRDDASFRLAQKTVDAQVKSRQPQQSAFRDGEVADFAVKLADRGRDRPADRLLLFLERGFPETGLDHTAAETTAVRQRMHDAITDRADEHRADDVVSRLHIVVIADPLDEATAELSRERGLRPAVARLAVQDLCAAIVTCTDLNAESTRAPATLTVTDATAIVDRVVEIVDIDSLDRVVRAGMCEAVDFSTPDIDERYLLGMATTPAHVAGGLVIDRPADVAAVASAISARRRVLIAGPSGAGKSALLWLVVHATRHDIRWFRIRRLDNADAVAALDRFARSLNASEEMPVGFVVDDVGRLGVARWDNLIGEAAQRPGVIVLGAIREGELTDIATLADVELLRPTSDEIFAEALWRALRTRGHTDWKGWREPFEQAEGLALEYVSLLTRGGRLREVLSAQIGALAREHGDNVLAVLAAVGMADRLAAIVTVEQLMSVTGLDRSMVTAAVRRLQDEFLIQVEGVAIGGLHQLRSAEAADIALGQIVRTVEDTVAALLGVIDNRLLEVALTHGAALIGELAVTQALRGRIARDSTADTLVSCLEGLRGVELHAAATDAAEMLQSSVAPGEMLEIVHSRFGAPIHDSITLRWDAPHIPSPSTASREALTDIVTAAPRGAENVRLLAAVLAAWPANTAPGWLDRVLADRLVAEEPGDIVALLDAARGHGQDVHRAVVDALGGPVAAACATAAHVDLALLPFDPAGRYAFAQVLGRRDGPFWHSDTDSADLVAQVMACSPTVDGVKLDVIDEYGRDRPALLGRPSLGRPVSAPPAGERRAAERHRAAILAALGVPRWTERLEEELRQVHSLTTALRGYLECLCVGRRVPRILLEQFGRLEQAAARLAPPPASAFDLDGPDDDQRVGARYEADPFASLLRDPGRIIVGAHDLKLAAAAAYRLWRVARDLRDARRWSLLAVPDDQAINLLVDTLYDLRTVLAERAAIGRGRWSSIAAGTLWTAGDRVRLAIQRSNDDAQARLGRQASALERCLQKASLDARVELIAAEDWPAAVWPPGQLVVTVTLDAADGWLAALDAVMAARGTRVDGERHVTVLVQLGGALSACLSGEAALAWWPRLDAAAAVGAAVRPEPRGIAWRMATMSAARLRVAHGWREALAATDTPVTALFTQAVNVTEDAARAARSRLHDLGLENAVAVFDALTVLEPNKELAAQGAAITAELAEADASCQGAS